MADDDTCVRLFDEPVRGAPDAFRAAELALRSALDDRRIHFGGRPLPTSLKPHLVAASVADAWVAQSDRFMTLIERLARRLVADPHFAAHVSVPARARPLFEIDPGYTSVAAITRSDIVWEGTRTRLLELNADSPAMMTFGDRVESIVQELFPLASPPRGVRLGTSTRTRNLLDALLACYRDWGGTSSTPTIALIDWPGVKTIDEQRDTAGEFTAHGCPAIVCAPHELSIREGRLYAQGRRIDIVQRRVLFPDFIHRADELATLIDAYRRGLVCMVNSLRSYLVGTKSFLAAIRSPEVLTGLPPAEAQLVREVVPEMRIVADDRARAELAAAQERWVLKPAFGHGGYGVVLGAHATRERWREALSQTRQAMWVGQVYQPIPRVRLPAINGGATVAFDEYYANWNPFYFGGRFAGAITRAAKVPIVGVTAAGALLPTVHVSGAPIHADTATAAPSPHRHEAP